MLTEKRFAYGIFALRQGRAPDPAKFGKLYLTGEAKKVGDKAEAKLVSEGVEYLEKGLAAFGGSMIGAIVKAKNSTLIGLAIDILNDWPTTELQNCSRAQPLHSHEIGGKRRLSLATKGEGQYRRVDPRDL